MLATRRTGAVIDEPSDEPREWAERKIEQAEHVYEGHGRVFRWMWIAVGFIIIAVGPAMIVFPGPVTVVVPLGLAMLAVVFGWPAGCSSGASSTGPTPLAASDVPALG